MSGLEQFPSTTNQGPQVLEKVSPEKTDQFPEKPHTEGHQEEPLPKDQIKELEGKMKTKKQEMTSLQQTINDSTDRLNTLREEMGLEEKIKDFQASDVTSYKDKIEKLKAEIESLKDQIEKIKENFLQQKIEKLFQYFKTLAQDKVSDISQTGVIPKEEMVQIVGINEMNPETVKSLIQKFQEGINSIAEILKDLPDLFEELSDNSLEDELEEELSKRLDENLEENKQPEQVNQDGDLVATDGLNVSEIRSDA